MHIQPYESRLVVRFRIDGILFDAFDVPKPLQEEVVSRIKVIGKMNIAEKRLPQDGRATVQVGDRRIDLRVASLPGSPAFNKCSRAGRAASLGQIRPALHAPARLE